MDSGETYDESSSYRMTNCWSSYRRMKLLYIHATLINTSWLNRSRFHITTLCDENHVMINYGMARMDFVCTLHF